MAKRTKTGVVKKSSEVEEKFARVVVKAAGNAQDRRRARRAEIRKFRAMQEDPGT